jgi:hypothetical protein
MRRAKWFTRGTLGIALLLALALGGSAGAQGTESVEPQLTPSRDSGVSGTATLQDVQGGVEVTLNMQGLPEAGIEHINHIHGGGTCGDDRAENPAPVTLPLTTITAEEGGTGSATTTLDNVTVGELQDPSEQQRYIAFHAEQQGEEVPPVISCADLTSMSGGQATAMAQGDTMMMEQTTMTESTMMMGEDLPQSGGPSLSMLLPAAALLLGSGILVFAVLRRR